MSILLTSDIGFHELRTFIEKEGNGAVVCCLKDAQHMMEQGRVDAVVLDWGDNPREGLVALRNLKVAHPEVPVIVLSAARSEETAVTAFRLGAKDYFPKPVNIPEVLEVLRNIIKLRRTSRERRFPYLTREGMVSSLLVSATSTMPPCILKAITHMADNFSGEITLAELADEAGMSKFHLCRSFKKSMAMSPMQFLSALRVERAKKLMEDTSLTITMIAMEVGFNDVSTFIGHFRKISGITPTAFRKSLRQAAPPSQARQ